MRILHVVYSCIPGVYRGGIAKIVYELACAQVVLGHDVSIYATDYNSSEKADVNLDQEVESKGVKIRYFPADDAYYKSSRRMLKAMTVNSGSFDVIHGHNTFLALNRYIARVSRRTSTPCYYHIHGALDPVVVNNGLIRRLRKTTYIYLFERRNYRIAKTLFANTENEKSQIRHWGIQTPVAITSNGIHLPAQEAADVEAPARCQCEERPKVLFVGRIVPKKGVHLLIEAFGALEDCQRDNAVLLIAGDRYQVPEYGRFLEQLILHYNLANNVIWLGFLSENEKKAVLRSADVFSHVSQSEGMAMSVLEAMAYGLPVILSKGCYMTDAANEGALVECDYTAAALRGHLASLLGNAEKRAAIGDKARQYAESNHSWAAVANQIAGVYKS